MNRFRSEMTQVAILPGTMLLCAAGLLGCAAREATPQLSAVDHEALAAQAASRGASGADEASAHRVAAQELRAAEESACAGISPAERNAGPFAGAEQVAKVEPLTEPVRVGKQIYPTVTGSKVTVMAAPGMTKQWLTRLAECHAARHASLGPSVDEGRPCPFSNGAVAIRVDEASTSFVVSVRSEAGRQGADQVLRTSQALRSSPDLRSAQEL